MAESHSEDEKQRWKRNLVETHFFVQMFVVTVLLLLILYGGYYHAQSYIPVPQSSDLSIKLAYSLQFCGLTSVLTLIVAIAMVESKRATTSAINPLAGRESHVQVDKNVLNNTVEQILIYVLASLILSIYLQPSEMRIIPLYTVVFVVGRVLFRIGYGIHPKYRLVGVEMNLCSNYFFAGLIIYLMYTRGFMCAVLQTAAVSSNIAAPPTTKAEL